MTGFLGANGQCFATSDEAVDHYYSSQPVSSFWSGATSVYFTQKWVKVGQYWGQQSARCTQTSNTPSCVWGVASMQTYSPPACTFEGGTTFADLNILIGAILTLWLVVFAAKQVINFFKVPHAE